MNQLVIDQGTILDRIDYNIENTHKKVFQSKGELTKVNLTIIFKINVNRREMLKKALELIIVYLY